MKLMKRAMGAVAFLAAFIMMASLMAPLVDAGAADSSAPVLFSESENSSDIDILRTWTNEEDGVKLQYAHTVYESKDAYGMLVYFKTILNEFTFGSTVFFKLTGPNSFKVEDQVSRDSDIPYLPLKLNDVLASGTYTLTISDNKAHVRPISTTTFTLGAVITDIIGGYHELAKDAKTAINSIWGGEDIADIDDKTMYVIYEQTGIFNDSVIGKLYFNNNEIYTEPLINKEGQRIWYFSFAEGAPTELSNIYVPGEYTLKIVGDGEVVAETTVMIEEQPEKPSLSIIDQGYGETKEEASEQINAVWGTPVDDVISKTMWAMFSQTGEFNTLMGELYFNDGTTSIYSEDLTTSCNASEPGNKLWYFSFDDQASVVTPIPGEYTLKIVGDGEVVAETTVTIIDPNEIFTVTINVSEGGTAYGTKLLHANDTGVIVITPDDGKTIADITVTNATKSSVSETVWTISNPTGDVVVNVSFKDKLASDDFRLEIKNVRGIGEGEYGFEASLISNDGNHLPNGTLTITCMISFFDEKNDCYAVVKYTESKDVSENFSFSIFPLNDGEMLVNGFAEFTYINSEGIEKTVTTETILAE